MTHGRSGTPRRAHGDEGQALPVYITAIGALLFLAFAYFAVGQAAATRNGAQTAADSAALAASADSRAQLRDELLRLFTSSGPLDGVGQLLDGRFSGLRGSCAAAARFAADNKAHTTDCHPVPGPGGYTVSVETDYTMGRSVVPGTEDKRAHADATAVITPLCRWHADPGAPTATATSTPPGGTAPSAPGTGPGPSASPSPRSPGTLECRDRTWTVDPSNPRVFPSAADLFSVHLIS